MSFCPSHAWDDYHDSQELPEECPGCGAANEDEEGEALEPEAPGFCSLDCEADWQRQQAAIVQHWTALGQQAPATAAD